VADRSSQPIPVPPQPPESRAGHSARVSAQLLAPFAHAAQALGQRVELGLARFGLALPDLEDADTRVGHDVVDRMLRELVARTGERDIGLLAAERVEPWHLDVVEYAARAQETLRSAIEHSIRYQALLHDGIEAELQLNGEQAVLRVRFSDPAPEAAHEFVLAVHLMAARRMTGIASLAPLETHFMHARPQNTPVHQRIFRSSLHFERSDTALVFSRASLDAKLLAADSGLAELLDRHAAEALQKLGRRTSLTERVRGLVRQSIKDGSVTGADAIARRLGMSSRTLHRRLVTLDATYRGIVDNVRRDIALQSLLDPRLTIREVGFMLGFTTSPAFHRAFRRWTGTTAATRRAEMLKQHEP